MIFKSPWTIVNRPWTFFTKLSMKKAVIDIGTNTFYLLIAQIHNQTDIEIIHKKTNAVKLGEGGVNKGFITEAAFERGINALIEFRKDLDTYQIKNVKATATAAVRDASNGAQFINDALAKAEIKIDVIDGLKEAEYIYLGAKSSGVLSAHTSLVMDIGGGSVEFIICNQDAVFWKKSYRLGAARLLADFFFEDPISLETISKINQLFKDSLFDLFEAIEIHKPIQLIGTAGSFDSYTELSIIEKNENFKIENIRFHQFIFNDFTALLEKIIQSTHTDRLNWKGLIPLRVDMILMASILTKYSLNNSKIETVTACTYSLKEGLLLSDF